MEIIALFIYGLIKSAILAVTAIGFSLTFGIAGIANLAYGGLFIIGAYLCWGLFSYLGLPYLVAVLLTLAAVGVLGFLIYWVVLYRVRGNILSEAIVTFGIGIGILEGLRWVGFVGFHYNLPPFVSGGVSIGGVPVDWHRLAIVCLAVALSVFLYLFTHHTKIGLSFRGVAQEEHTALSVGINPDLAAALSMGIGSALAAVAALAILPMGTIQIERGYQILIFALAVGIVGGLESAAGVITASLILGYVQTAAGLYIGAHWEMIVLIAGIIVILALRPSGLFGRFKELEERI